MNKKTLVSTIGVITLGALGSGLWELVKPFLAWGWSGLLTIATLGMDSLRDGIYADAASVIGKPTGLAVATQGLSVLILFTGVAIISYIRISFRPAPHFIAKVYFGTLFVAAIAFTVAVNRSSYVTQLAAYNAKLEVIATPYFSDTQMNELRAEYVQIDNRAAYLAHIAKLQKAIEAGGKKVQIREFF